MSRRHFASASPEAIEALSRVDRYLDGCGLPRALLELVRLRVSQINRCAFCIDMHWRRARALGEPEERLYGLTAFREHPGYSERERAALGWTEAVTTLDGHVPDDVYEAARAEFEDRELVDLTVAIGMIGAWNRLAIATRTSPTPVERTRSRGPSAELAPRVVVLPRA